MISGQIVCQNYKIIKKLGEGSFGYVYKVINLITNQQYALKTDQKSITKMQLQNQFKVLKEIQKKIKIVKSQNQNSSGYLHKCQEFYFSQETFNKMIMPLYGENLYNLFQKCNKRWNAHTIYTVSLNMLRNIQFLHELGYIHRDIKLQNFVVGKKINIKNQNQWNESIFLIDFGLAKSYINQINKQSQHIQYDIGKKIRGTPMYMSVNVMLGIQPSRRDDLESLIYLIILMIKGRLPWHNIKISRKDLDDVVKSKIAQNPDDLFTGLPKQLKQIYKYIRKLKFQQKPDYNKIAKCFESILTYRNQSIQLQYYDEYKKYCWQKVQQKEKLSALMLQKAMKHKKIVNSQQLQSEKEITLLR